MEHTTTALPSVVPLLHRRQKYMGASSEDCDDYGLGFNSRLLAEGSLVNIAHLACACTSIRGHERSQKLRCHRFWAGEQY